MAVPLLLTVFALSIERRSRSGFCRLAFLRGRFALLRGRRWARCFPLRGRFVSRCLAPHRRFHPPRLFVLPRRFLSRLRSGRRIDRFALLLLREYRGLPRFAFHRLRLFILNAARDDDRRRRLDRTLDRTCLRPIRCSGRRGLHITLPGVYL